MTKLPIKILYVEDHKETSISLYNILSKFCEKVVLANNGVNALRTFEANHNFDLVITDVNMPIMDGLDLVKEIRELDKDIQIYVTSAYKDTKEPNLKNYNVNRFFPKPTDIETLLKYIKEDFS